MNNIKSKHLALNIMFFILVSVLVFHVLIFTEQISYDKVWAGRLNSIAEMKSFETVSILINIFMLSVLIIKQRQLNRNYINKITDLIIWIFIVFFVLNTFGNLFSKSILELILGTFFTLLSAILCFIIVKKKTQI